jgi:hypothetical protein
MKFVIRRTPLGFETYLFWDGALARVSEVLDLRAIPNQSPQVSPQIERLINTMFPANAGFAVSNEASLAVVN